MAFLLIQTLYWLALAFWLGGVMFVAIAAPIIHRTIRQAHPNLPDVLSVNLENEHGSLLAGSIVGNLLRMLSSVQFFCAGIMLLMLIGQWFLMSRSNQAIVHGILRSSLFVGAVMLASYDRWILSPRIWHFRQEYIDHADEPELANPAKDQFDRYHRESVRVLFMLWGLLSLIVVFSSVVQPGI
jgi:hypothetical protein